jgi:hypothetical protein
VEEPIKGAKLENIQLGFFYGFLPGIALKNAWKLGVNSNLGGIMLYAYRCEACVDEKRFLNELIARGIVFKFNTEWHCDDVIIDIGCDDIIKLWKIIRSLPDCHVLADTFAYLGNFTGYRKYQNPPDGKPSPITCINTTYHDRNRPSRTIRTIRNIEKERCYFLREYGKVPRSWLRHLRQDLVSKTATVTIYTLPA